MDQRRCFGISKRIFNQPTVRVHSLCTGETPLRMTFRGLLNQSITRCLTEDGLKTPDRV